MLLWVSIILCACQDVPASDLQVSPEEETVPITMENTAEANPDSIIDVSSISYDELESWRDDPDIVEEWKETHDFLAAFVWEDVDSSAIRETAYSWLWGAAAIRFHSNPSATYVYYDVPEYIYDELVGADSVGGYYNTYIKGQFTCERFD